MSCWNLRAASNSSLPFCSHTHSVTKSCVFCLLHASQICQLSVLTSTPWARASLILYLDSWLLVSHFQFRLSPVCPSIKMDSGRVGVQPEPFGYFCCHQDRAQATLSGDTAPVYFSRLISSTPISLYVPRPIQLSVVLQTCRTALPTSLCIGWNIPPPSYFSLG